MYHLQSRKICIASIQCDNSDLDIHNAEDKKLPVFIMCSYERTRRLSTIEIKKESRFFCNYCDSCNDSSYAFNCV